jgi:hypothetical protein
MPGGTPAALRPDGASDLSDGIVVQTQLLGRVLGVRLLRVDGTVLVSPGRLVTEPLAEPLADHRAPSAPALAAGSELVEAARLLRENDEVLGRRA